MSEIRMSEKGGGVEKTAEKAAFSSLGVRTVLLSCRFDLTNLSRLSSCQALREFRHEVIREKMYSFLAFDINAFTSLRSPRKVSRSTWLPCPFTFDLRSIIRVSREIRIEIAHDDDILIGR